MEQQVQRGKKWLEEMLALMGVPAKVNPAVTDNNGTQENWLVIEEDTLTSQQIGVLTGAQGETLDAIQYLANTLLNIGVSAQEQGALTIELNGYRIRRQAELMSQIEQVVQQVRETGQEYEMKSLSSAERRQVHHLLEAVEDLETQSRGQEPHRMLVVRLRSSD